MARKNKFCYFWPHLENFWKIPGGPSGKKTSDAHARRYERNSFSELGIDICIVSIICRAIRRFIDFNILVFNSQNRNKGLGHRTKSEIWTEKACSEQELQISFVIDTFYSTVTVTMLTADVSRTKVLLLSLWTGALCYAYIGQMWPSNEFRKVWVSHSSLGNL